MFPLLSYPESFFGHLLCTRHCILMCITVFDLKATYFRFGFFHFSKGKSKLQIANITISIIKCLEESHFLPNL
jgi:hypothetical protein